MATASAEITSRLGNQRWRLDNLYWITDKDGNKIRFRMNWAQRELFDKLWFWTLILKARQLGMTTFVHLLMLDTAMFNPGMRMGVIAHDLEAVKELFERDVKQPYEALPASIRAMVPAHRDAANRLTFANGSSIRVATSFRSGTYQILHVSEFGKICARYPQRAREIVTGAFEAVGTGNMVIVESTAEGREGYFYDYCQEAQALADAQKSLNPEEWRFLFFPWWRHPEYRTRHVQGVVISDARTRYFDDLEAQLGIQLPLSRRAWYAQKAAKLGDEMYREYPSTPPEAFFASVMGAYYKRQITEARKGGRITTVPILDGFPVETWWDIGVGDSTSIWFVQPVGRELRFVDYYESSGEGLSHYVRVLRERDYLYGTHYAPHDIEVREWGGDAISRKARAEQLGIRFVTVPHYPLDDGIEAVRDVLPTCVFDAERCDQGLKALESYRKEWDEAHGCYRDRPVHDWASHGADAFRTGIVGRQTGRHRRVAAPDTRAPAAEGWT